MDKRTENGGHSTKAKDIQAGKLYLEYYVGKPKEGLDVTTNGNTINIPVIRFKASNE